ncbi:MAG: UDP-N-acetylmuramoyl-tripeptide--D-alanyl-D-alanine ligase [Kiloniellales bacterium]
MSASLWTAAEAAEATGGRATGTWSASGVAIDSRTIEPGDLFIAIEGPNFDGHDFVGKALEAGAVAALVHRRSADFPRDAPLLEVQDTLKALGALGEAARKRTQARCLGITGSVGKTSSKEMLRAALATAGRTYASVASFNNHWGVPLSLARMPLDAQFGVFEMGMNHAGEIRELVAIVRPEVALITQIAPAHIAFFPDGLDGIAAAKAEIFEGLQAGGTAVINADAPRAAILLKKAKQQGARIVTFGAAEEADYRLLKHEDGITSRVSAALPSGSLTFSLGLPGRHMALNALGVIAAAVAVDIDPAVAASGLESLRPLRGRGARRQIDLPDGGTITLIDEGYNANPTSVAAALGLLAACRPGDGGRRIAVLGDMLELGEAAGAMHAGLSEAVISAGTDLLFTCGTEMQALQEALPSAIRAAHRATSAELAPVLLDTLQPGDAVLVKGSLGSKMANIIAALEGLAGTESDRRTG